VRTVRNITVAVTADLYRQTRKLAAEYDTTVTAIVAYLLQRLPNALKRAEYPVGGPKPAPSARPAPSAAQTAAASANPRNPSSMNKPDLPPTPSPQVASSAARETELNPPPSVPYGGNLPPDTAPVRQYVAVNQHIVKDLRTSI
jgi:hypothetical protein